MRNKFIILAWLCTCLSVNIFAQEYVLITYSDTYDTVKSSWNNLPMLDKKLRKNANSTPIIITDDSELDEQTSKVVNYVMSVWESYIVNGVNLYVKIELTSDIEEDIQTIVGYDTKDGIMYPLSLKHYMDGLLDRDHTHPDGIIRINSNTTWDYGLGDNISPDGNNLALGIMRSMARIMGFGSNISMNDNGDYFFSDKPYHSIFNTRIVNSSNKYLKDIEINRGNPNALLKSYIEEPNQSFWIVTDNDRYKLASSPYSEDNMPFVYLYPDEDKTCLMSANLSVGNYILRIDDTTRDILNSLGWNIQAPSPILIIGEDIDETGLASAYESHSFTVNKKDMPMTDPTWTLQIPKANGDIESMALADEGLACTTPPITNEKDYLINPDGEIEAQLFFSCISNGKEIKTPPFNIYFELKPYIIEASIIDIHDNTPYASYDASYKVEYRGADKVKVSVEEEYGSKLKSHYTNEPYIAYGTADHITSPYYAWIDFIVENQYGKSVYTIELPPRQAGVDLCNGDNDDIYEVYNAAGIKMGAYKTIDEIQDLTYKGVLLIKQISNNVVVKTFKLLRK